MPSGPCAGSARRRWPTRSRRAEDALMSPSATPAVVPEDRQEALVAALVELEHHVGESGWDAPPRLFALVETDALAAAEPDLARSLGLRTTADGAAPGALTAIEQDTFRPSGDLLTDLDGIEWPEDVF